MNILIAFVTGILFGSLMRQIVVAWVKRGIGKGGTRTKAWEKALREMKHDDLIRISTSISAEVARRGITTAGGR